MKLRFTLGALLAFAFINAAAGAWYGLSGAPGVPREWLAGSVFESYFVPSLILLVAVGGSCLVAAVSVFAGLRIARLATIAAAVILLGWIAVQISIIGYVSFLQPACVVAALVMLGLAKYARSRVVT